MKYFAMIVLLEEVTALLEYLNLYSMIIMLQNCIKMVKLCSILSSHYYSRNHSGIIPAPLHKCKQAHNTFAAMFFYAMRPTEHYISRVQAAV